MTLKVGDRVRIVSYEGGDETSRQITGLVGTIERFQMFWDVRPDVWPPALRNRGYGGTIPCKTSELAPADREDQVSEWLADISMVGPLASLEFRLGVDTEALWLQIRDTSLPPEIATGRKWRISDHMIQEEVVSTAFRAVLTWFEHEIRESFLWKRRAVFGPHISLDALHAAADQTTVRPPP